MNSEKTPTSQTAHSDLQRIQKQLDRCMVNRRRTEELKDRNDQLLNRVIADIKSVRDELQLKNQEMESANQQLRAEMERRNSAIEERDALQAELVEIARRVGLEELTTNILHNVGNTLNSVNVALSKMEKQIIASKVNSIPQLAALFDEHKDNLAHFLLEDPRGQKIPEYIQRLGDVLESERQENEEEIEVMRKSVDHINQIVSYQQAYSKIVAFKETMSVCDLIKDAIAITQGELIRFGVQVSCQFDDVPDIEVDRRKLIQILLNLISNAKHSLVDRGAEERWIYIRVKAEDDILRIEVEDNGYGILTEHMSQLFTFGFTTREEGHGFGLHGCANHAREMDGKIYAHSEGRNKGALFVFDLPMQNTSMDNNA